LRVNTAMGVGKRIAVFLLTSVKEDIIT